MLSPEAFSKQQFPLLCLRWAVAGVLEPTGAGLRDHPPLAHPVSQGLEEHSCVFAEYMTEDVGMRGFLGARERISGRLRQEGCQVQALPGHLSGLDPISNFKKKFKNKSLGMYVSVKDLRVVPITGGGNKATYF